MALNWALVAGDAKNPVPLPLPEEEFFFSKKKVSLALELGSNGYPGNGGQLKADGIIHITNQRPTVEHLKSLSIPLKNLRDGKLAQPWFGANYYTATVLPVPNEHESNAPQTYEQLPSYTPRETPENAATTTAIPSSGVLLVSAMPSPNPFITTPPTSTLPNPLLTQTSDSNTQVISRSPSPVPHQNRPANSASSSTVPVSDLPPSYDDITK
ncbi:7550_t:CDS:2 [Ambispora gerdemannii]|uniref:7550_t:CDS:1 n=1 Tax=Ambispora gerdemannii TaxID=144530 RepID=A0A9N8WJU7_9GLOM|nr:7550_t:CDS:2 [Ambispora gerdemannii]